MGLPVRALALAVIVATAAAAGCDRDPPASRPDPTPTAATAATSPPPGGAATLRAQVFDLPAGAGPHDVAPAADGGVWFTAQSAGYLGHLDANSGRVTQVPLGSGARPHGVIVDSAGAAWVTDGGLNAIIRVDGESRRVRPYPLPLDRPNANLNTAAFDGRGVLWFTGQSGIYGSLDPHSGQMRLFDAPGGRGPYGITATPAGDVYYASLAGHHIARIDVATGAATRLEPPTARQGARRVWSDSRGRIWVSEYEAGQVARYDPATGGWQEWKLPDAGAQAYAVYVDSRDVVWLSDTRKGTVVRFDPSTETFTTVDVPGGAGTVRQILGRAGEVWFPSGRNVLFVVKG
jgi:virginiamycin B lyase